MAFFSALVHSQVWTLVHEPQSRSDIGLLTSWSSSFPHVKFHRISRSWSTCSSRGVTLTGWRHHHHHLSAPQSCTTSEHGSCEWWWQCRAPVPRAPRPPASASWSSSGSAGTKHNNTITALQRGSEISFYNCNTHSQPGQGEAVSGTHRPPTTATEGCVLWHN